MTVSLDRIYHAAFVLKDVIRNTDLIPAQRLLCANKVYLKTENLQHTGSFKLRGAYYKISQLSTEEASKGIVACSAGNHAQGVALASQRRGLDCTICMPDIAPISKVEATKGYGAKVRLVKDSYDDAYQEAIRLQQEEGYTFIHPFDDEEVIAGQGTIGLEILEKLSDIDAVVVPVGGGGLISGVGAAIKLLKPECKVYGVQAAGAPSMFNSFKSGNIEELERVDTFADGIAVKVPGRTTFEMVDRYVDDMITVSEDEIAAAILTLMEKQKLVAEGAGATALAATLFDKLPISGKNVVPIISGGNIDVNILNRVITRGLIMGGRRTSLNIPVMDKPGQLHEVSSIISRCGANVITINHDSSDPNMAVNSCILKIVLETRDAEQIRHIKESFVQAGYSVL